MSTYEEIGDGRRESAISEGFFVETLYVQRDATIQKERQVRYTAHQICLLLPYFTTWITQMHNNVLGKF